MENTSGKGWFLGAFILFALFPIACFSSCGSDLIVFASKSGKWHQVDGDSPLRSGDRLRIELQTTNACYMAFFWKDARNQVFNLTPKSINLGDSQQTVPYHRYALPGNGRVYTLDHSTGNEILVLAASDVPIANLNALGRLISRSEFATSSGMIRIDRYDLRWMVLRHREG